MSRRVLILSMVSQSVSNNLILSIGRPPGYDRVRGAEIGNKDFNLDVLEEAYTTEHWLVRIYKVKPLPNRGLWANMTDLKCAPTQFFQNLSATKDHPDQNLKDVLNNFLDQRAGRPAKIIFVLTNWARICYIFIYNSIRWNYC